MKMKTLSIIPAVLMSVFVLATFPLTTEAATTTPGTCTVISPTATTTALINAPGTYCLNANVSMNRSSGNAISFGSNANNVVLDLNGYTMTNTNTSSTADGIGLETSAAPVNVTIRNGKIIGFRNGIRMRSGSKINVENIHADASYAGIDLRTTNSIIRNNYSIGEFRGIIACEADMRILNNDIIGYGGGIDTCHTARFIIEGNRIINPTTNGGNGIWLNFPTDGLDHIVVNNRFYNWTIGIDGGPCKMRDNLFVNVPAWGACTDVGNNY